MADQPENKTQKIARIALFGALVVGVVGWQQGIFKDLLPASVKTASSEKSVLSSEDAALTEKLQPFIECLNRVDTALRNHYQSYSETFARRVSSQDNTHYYGFTSFKIAPYETNNDFTRECAEKLEAAVKQKPADPALDNAGQTYAETLRGLIPVMNDADSYYKQENYRDDNMQKGKELNTQLNPKFEKLFATSDEIHKMVDAHTLTLRTNELAAMEKEYGRDFEWHTVNLAHQARLALDSVNTLVEQETLSVETITPIEKNYETAFNEAKAYANANPDTQTSLGNKPRWFSIDRNFENMLGALRTLRRDMAEKKDIERINRNLENISSEYNSMIRSYNQSARFSR